jgi:hypothetical protein
MHPLLIEGISDAVGFVGGALLGYWLAVTLVGDPMQAGYDSGSIFGIVLIGLGGGIGLKLARRWRAQRLRAQADPDTSQRDSRR